MSKFCEICKVEYTESVCPTCKARAEKEHSAKMNAEAVDRIKTEETTTSMSKEDSDKTASIFFEDDVTIKLRDGKKYQIPPSSLKNARKLMGYLKTVNMDHIIMNFLPSGDEGVDSQKQEDLISIMQLALINYPEITPEYIEEFIDVRKAREIIEILMDLNGLKK